MREEYFSATHQNHPNQHNQNNPVEQFVSLSGNPEQDDIAKTIAINCKAYPGYHNRIMEVKPIPEDELDTPEYARFKPLEYNPKRLYYWRRDILIPEGIRRSQDDDTEIARVQSLFDAETDPDKKQILQDELDLFQWRSNILALQKPETGENRSMRDITTDYYPSEIGMSRIWREPHSHIKDYSHSLNYGYKAYKNLDKTKEELKEELNLQQKCKIIANKMNAKIINATFMNNKIPWKPNEDKYISKNYSRTGLIL